MTGTPLETRPPRAQPRVVAGGPWWCAAPVVSAICAVALAFAPGRVLAGPAEPLPSIADEPAPPAEGGNDEMLERAMSAYERGQQNYKLAQYEAALADFKEASTLYASPDFQYNIGLCYEKLGQYDEAVLAYVTYLKVKPDAEDRANVEATVARLQELSRSQKQRAADDDDDRTPITTPAPVPVTPDEPPTPKPWKPLVISGAVIAGVGAVIALGGGIAFGVLAKRRSDDLDAVQNGGNPDEVSFDDAQALESDGKRFETVQIGMAAGGAAVAVVGGALLAVGLLRRKKQGAATAQLVPSFGTEAAGLALVGRF